MSEQFRALTVILALAFISFHYCKKLFSAAGVMSEHDFARRRNYWYLVTIVGFISPNYWVFSFAVCSIFLYAANQDKNKIALFFFLVLALPQTRVEVPGILGINYLVEVDYVKLLTLSVLAPLSWRLWKINKNNKNNLYAQDIVLMIYIIFNLILRMRFDTGTGLLRYCYQWLVDVIIPYYAVSRGLKQIEQIKEAIGSIVAAAIVVSMIGLFEYGKHWLLYSALSSQYSNTADVGGYLLRGDILRAMASSGQPIVLGYVIAVAIGFYFYIQTRVLDWRLRLIGMTILFSGIIAPISRGPWVGMFVMLSILFLYSRERTRILFKSLIIIPIALVVLMVSDVGTKLIDYLPFVGTVEAGNVEYRKILFNVAIDIIVNNPLIGSVDYLLSMEHLRTGQGIIDLVNTYLIVALNTGLIGLALFLLFFMVSLARLRMKMQLVIDNIDEYAVGRSIFAVLIGVLVVIATTSPIFHVPIFYWTIGAMCIAYVNSPFIKVPGSNLARCSSE